MPVLQESTAAPAVECSPQRRNHSLLAVHLRVDKTVGMKPIASALLAAAFALSPTIAFAQDAPPPATPAANTEAAIAETPARVPAVQHVTLTTALGDVVIALEIERAPLSAAQFLRYVDSGRLVGTSFYRAMDLGRGYGLVQGGTRGLPGRTFAPIPHESTRQTGLSHVDGAISWARLNPGTAAGDFFIILGGLTALDAQPPENGGDPDGFAVFGRVVRGMDVVRAIVTLPTDPNLGEGVMRGQMLASGLPIAAAVRSVPPTTEPVAPATPTSPSGQ